MGEDAQGELRSPVEAVDRALRLLEALAEADGEGATLSELAGRLDMNKSTAHRTLAALRVRGFAEQDLGSGRYQLGPTLARLGEEYMSAENLPHLVRPALQVLSSRTEELVHLGTLSGAWVTYVAKVEPVRPVRVWSAVGRRSPAITTALGRALLSVIGVDPTDIDRYLEAAAPRHVSAEYALGVLHDAATLGYAREVEENEEGVSCVAVPLLRAGVAVAAVSVTAPSERMTPERILWLVEQMHDLLPSALPHGLHLGERPVA